MGAPPRTLLTNDVRRRRIRERRRFGSGVNGEDYSLVRRAGSGCLLGVLRSPRYSRRRRTARCIRGGILRLGSVVGPASEWSIRKGRRRGPDREQRVLRAFVAIRVGQAVGRAWSFLGVPHVAGHRTGGDAAVPDPRRARRRGIVTNWMLERSFWHVDEEGRVRAGVAQVGGTLRRNRSLQEADERAGSIT